MPPYSLWVWCDDEILLMHNVVGSSGNVEFNDLPLATYVLKIVVSRPGKRIIERRVLHIVGKYYICPAKSWP